MPATSPPPPASPPFQNGAADVAPPSESPHPTPVNSSVSPSIDATSPKKTYLALLPPAQIIEICLLFEPHVPLHVKSTIWPADLEAAILELKKTAQPQPPPPPSLSPQPDVATANLPPLPSQGNASPSNAGTPSHQVHPPGPPAPPVVDRDPPMGSLRDPAEEAREKEKASNSDSGATITAAPSPAPQPNGAETSNANAPSLPHAGPFQPTPAANALSQPQAGPSQPTSAPASHASTPQPQAQHASLHPPNPYPYTHYSYAVPQPQNQQTAYPHAPYYAPPAAYPAHYQYSPYGPPPGYPAPAPAHSPPPPHPHGQHPLFNSTPLVRPPIHPIAPPAQPPPSEDLPSYEEMIVEALLDCGDAEGAAPKDLFTWMAARYPLQTNFRPSASQALQKAYKRGRLEKRGGGKYRLNPTWEGGATSKRTTRRPQTLAQTTYAAHHAPTQPSSPFTHAPLQQHPQPPTPGGAQPPYNGYPYSYPYGHYPGYPHPAAGQSVQAKTASRPPPAAPAHTATASGTAKTAEEKDESGEGSDAWEAAQHILQAINFGGLELATSASSSSNASGAASSSAAPPPVLADGDADLAAVLSALVNAAGAAAPAEPPRAVLTEDERAALQAQLALLAAQLTEIAEGDEDEEPTAYPPTVMSSIHIQAPQPTQPSQPMPQPQPTVVPEPPRPASPPQVAQPSSRPAIDQPPPPMAAYAGGPHLVLDVNAFPELFASIAASSASAAAAAAVPVPAGPSALGSGHQTEVDELADEDSDEDEDMEDVVVPLHPRPTHASPQADGVRT
ncbi:hypothetical protein TRAPUB_8254 [Trametes pubescens]|uniref:Histone H1 n=1 Tax=Trametes pubescens TaxID=154538 RepID=A0A1M2W5Y0_TRAPU|nr:hypothetical protein TRAPUB_8254 [Trametes pubescens]